MEEHRFYRMNQPVLVLNGNFEPLNVCSTRRALALLVLGKASVVEDGRGQVCTARGSYPRPSVIRLAYVIRRPRPRVRLNNREVFRRDAFRCVYCGQHAGHLTLDHVVPRHRGGPHSWRNLVTACDTCNRRKGGHTPEEAGLELRYQPYEPPPTTEYLFGQHLPGNGEWERYIAGW